MLVTGRNKLVINHLGRLFVTSDAATIIREIEVVHPAAKLVVMASKAQEEEVSLFFWFVSLSLSRIPILSFFFVKEIRVLIFVLIFPHPSPSLIYRWAMQLIWLSSSQESC